jgi:hypothetical protein
LPLGSLNWSTSFCRLVIVIDPSNRKNPYLSSSVSNKLNKQCVRLKGKISHFLLRQSFSNRSSVWV